MWSEGWVAWGVWSEGWVCGVCGLKGVCVGCVV